MNDGPTCDWGYCDEPAVALRLDRNEDGQSKGLLGIGGYGWLPVCEEHRAPYQEGEAALGDPPDFSNHGARWQPGLATGSGDDVMMTGDHLRTWRAGMEMSQADLAAALRVDVTTVARWERGERRIPGHLVLALEALERRRDKSISVDQWRLTWGRSSWDEVMTESASAAIEDGR